MNIILSIIDYIFYFHMILPVMLLIAVGLKFSGVDILISYLARTRALINAFNSGLGRTISWASLIMVFVMFAIVLMRYIFGIGYIWMQESITYMHALLFLLAAGFTLLLDGHVRVDIFYREAAPTRKALVNLLGTYFFLFPIMYLIVDTALPYIEFAWNVKEGSKETSGIQAVYLLKSVIVLFAWSMILQGISLAISSVFTLIGHESETPVEDNIAGGIIL